MSRNEANVEQEGGDKPIRNSHCVVIVYVGNYVMLNDSISDGPMCASGLSRSSIVKVFLIQF